ncbi:hypothetical protein ACHAWF_010056 [Thalassiosira exigua]
MLALLTPWLITIIKSVAAVPHDALASDSTRQLGESYIQHAILRGLSERLEHHIGYGTPSSTEIQSERQEDFSGNSGRRLSSPDYAFASCENEPNYLPCGAVIAKYTAAELKDFLDASFSKMLNGPHCVSTFPTCGVDGRNDGCRCIHDAMCFFDQFCALEICPDQCYDITFEPRIASAIQNGIEIRKICSSCDEESKLGNTLVDSKDLGYCTGYGKDATVSGLLLIPTDAATGQAILPGPLETHVHSDPTVYSTCSGVSSADLSDGSTTHFSSLTALLMASLGRVIVIPDTMGIEESYNFFKGVGLKKQYQTSAMPLWFKAKRIVSEETSIEVSNNVVVSGYSAGGYGAVAIAEALESSGANIIKLLTGGAPFRLSSTQMLHSYVGIVDGTLPKYAASLVMMVGQAFSSTIEGPENYQMNQDLLANRWSWNGTQYTKYDMINITTSKVNRNVLFNFFPTSMSRSWLDAWNSNMVDFISVAVQDGDLEPCKNATRVAEATSAGKPVNKLCEALRANDLDDYIREISYPFEICHSPNDDAVPIEHAIEFSDAIHYSFGDHLIGGVYCFMRYVSSLLKDPPIKPEGTSEETGEANDSGSG